MKYESGSTPGDEALMVSTTIGAFFYADLTMGSLQSPMGLHKIFGNQMQRHQSFLCQDVPNDSQRSFRWVLEA